MFGVIWEVELAEKRKLFFASIGDYERFQRDPQTSECDDMQPEEIMHMESIAS
ncbi:MAG: hypothetical protein IPP33_16675 [Flavobacteriales bacterium]|nr:hypothetical protein [Flavobacteriales bacterium]